MADKSLTDKAFGKAMQSILLQPSFSEAEVESYGLWLAGCRGEVKNPARIFHALYGSTARVLSEQFDDLMTTNIRAARLSVEERTGKGLRSFLIAHHWLWTGPKNVVLTSTRFQICEKYCQGEALWSWIRKIAALEAQIIAWEERTSQPVSIAHETFTLSVDGTDFKTWEPKHPTLPIDTGYASHKFKSAGYRYEIAISMETGNCVWLYGPHRAGKHDMAIMREALKSKLKQGEAVIADSGYQTSRTDEAFMSTPNTQDSKEVARFKSIARCRHESFNGRLKYYASMEHTWRHGMEKHGWALRAVAVTVQYHINFGSNLFKV